MSRPDPLIILGMHRSGTSCLAGSLEQAGLYLGRVNTKAAHNKKGNRENPHIMALNDALLRDAGGAWDKPPDLPITWSAANLETRDRIIASSPADTIWGFKDPRTLLTFEGWSEALPAVKLVGTFRHPLAVARSLNLRSRIATAKAVDLWMAYNTRLLDLCGERDIELVPFDWPAERYREGLESICRSVGLTIPDKGFDFFSSSLRHHSPTPGYTLPAEVIRLYDALCDYAVEL